MMSRMTAAILLLLILVISTTSASTLTNENPRPELLEFTSAGFTLKDILTCRCKTTISAKYMCPRPLIPTNENVKGDLKKCLCRKITEHCNSRIEKFCKAKCSRPPPSPL